MSSRFIVVMSLLFAFTVVSLVWAIASDPRFSSTPAWRPHVYVNQSTWWSQCWNYRNVYRHAADGHVENVLEPKDCESGGWTVYIEGVPYPTPKRIETGF